MPLHYCLDNTSMKPNGQDCGMCPNHVGYVLSSSAEKIRKKKKFE